MLKFEENGEQGRNRSEYGKKKSLPRKMPQKSFLVKKNNHARWSTESRSIENCNYIGISKLPVGRGVKNIQFDLQKVQNFKILSLKTLRK